MLKKSILILVMADNSDFIQKELAVVKNTWAKPVIEGEYTNIQFFSYTAMDEKMKSGTAHRNLGAIDTVCDTVFVPTDDDIFASYRKTYATLKTLEPYIKRHKIDYIFKTTPYTYVNVPLLDEFVQKYIQYGEEVIYTGKIKSAKEAIGPKPFCLFADRSSMLIPVRPYFNVLTDIKYRTDAVRNDVVKPSEYWDIFRMNVDENAMGFVIDNYLLSLGRDHSEYYRDWNIRTFDELPEDMWFRQIVMNMRHCKCHKCEIDDIRYVHDVVSDYYLDNKKPDMSYILNYMYSTICPKIFAVDETKDQDEYYQLTLDEYKMIFKKRTIDVSLKPSGSISVGAGGENGTCPSYPTVDGSDGQCYHYSYLDWFNVPHHHLDNCPAHHEHNNSSNGSVNSSNVSNNSSNDSSNSDYVVNEEITVDPNKGQHVNVKKPHCHCSTNVKPDTCDCDSPVIEAVRMCVTDNGHKHYVTLYPSDHVYEPCDCSSRVDNLMTDTSDTSIVPDEPTISDNPDMSFVEVTKIPSKTINVMSVTENETQNITSGVDSSVIETDEQVEEAKDEEAKDEEVKDSSCSCFDTESIWCNCDCDYHNWWHDPSTGDSPCNSAEGCPETKPRPPKPGGTPDSSHVVGPKPEPEEPCDKNITDDINRLKELLGTINPR